MPVDLKGDLFGNILGGLKDAILGGSQAAIGLTGMAIGLSASILKLQNEIVKMSTGFDVGVGSMVTAFNKSVEAFHAQTQATLSMGVDRAKLVNALRDTIEGFEDIPGSIDEKLSTSIRLFQFGIGANQEASLKLATALRLQGAAGTELVIGINKMGRSLFMTQDSIDELMTGILNASESQSITSEALVKGLSETAAALKPTAMIPGFQSAMMSMGSVALQNLGEQGAGAFNELMKQILDPANIAAGGLLGMDMSFLNDLQSLAEVDPEAAYQMLMDQVQDMGGQIGAFIGSEDVDPRLRALLGDQALGSLGPAIRAMITAMENAEAGVGAGAFGLPDLGTQVDEAGKPKDALEIATDLLQTQTEQVMNSIREQAHELGRLQQENAVKLHDAFVQNLIDPLADTLNRLIITPMNEYTDEDGNIRSGMEDFAISFSENTGKMIAQFESVINALGVTGDTIGGLAGAMTSFHELLVDVVIPGIGGFIGDLIDMFQDKIPEEFLPNLRGGAAAPGLVGDPGIPGAVDSEGRPSAIPGDVLIDIGRILQKDSLTQEKLSEKIEEILVLAEVWRANADRAFTPEFWDQVSELIFKNPNAGLTPIAMLQKPMPMTT